jgi:1-acyl-sn-glycerol-3-phosphate acyltransferase
MIRTILFFAYFWVSLLLVTPICVLYFPLKLLGIGGPFRPAFQAVVRAWARSLFAITGTEIAVEGLERIPAKGPVCLVGNHQGDMDITCVLALVPRTVGFVAKSQGMYIPFLNLWIAALDSVFVDRANVRKAMRSIERGVAKIRRGSALMIFPEGTRSRGPAMGVFKPGAFKLATKAGAPIIPISIDGAYRMWEESKRIRPGKLSFTVHEPIVTAGMGPEERKRLPERVRAIIAGGLNRPGFTG